MFPGRSVTDPIGDQWQENWFTTPWRWPGPDVGPRRNAPRDQPFREWDPMLKRWRRGPHILHNFKPSYYWTRPHDGKRSGAMGRLKDALTGEGPDVFITISGEKRTLMRDRPQRWQWTEWGLTPKEIDDRIRWDKDFRMQDFEPMLGAPWTEHRSYEPFYNFRNREFESARQVMRHPEKVWTNANWPEGVKHSSREPLNVRDHRFNWWSRVEPYAGFWPGGRPKHMR